MPDQVLKDREYMAAVFDNAFEHCAEVRLSLAFTIPLGENGGRHRDIAANFFGRMSAQEKPVKESGLALRELEILRGLVQRIGLSRHVEKGSLQISASPSRVPTARGDPVMAG